VAELNSTFDPHLGYLAFGGIAPVKITDVAATVPIRTHSFAPRSSVKYGFYSVAVDSYLFNGSTPLAAGEKQGILDTGTTLNYLPPAIAKAYNAKFVPPATYDGVYQLYVVDCNATAPPFAVVIGGKKFTIDGRDNILPIDTTFCISGTQNSPVAPNNSMVYIILCVLYFCNTKTISLTDN
jgi:hypothetical protein